MRKTILALLITASIAAPMSGSLDAATRKRTSAGVRKEQRQTQQRIRQTKEQLEENRRQAASNLNKLNRLNADISEQKKSIKALSDSIKAVKSSIRTVSDSVKNLERDMKTVRSSYADALRAARRRRSTIDDRAYIFSSQNVKQGLSRYRYIQSFAAWLVDKSSRLKTDISELEKKRDRLSQLKTTQERQLKRLSDAQDMLIAQQSATEVLVKQLQDDRSSLDSYLKQQQKLASSLDAELDRIIAEEIRLAEERRKREEEARRKAEEEASNAAANSKPQAGNKPPKKPAAPSKPSSQTANDTKLSGSFESNKGRLPAPVACRYKVVKPYGITKHPSLPKVMVENSGIDIEVPSGTQAQAVFDGEVTVVFRPSGYQTVIVVRHGKYLTVYGNLDNINVAKGDKVKRGQALGHIFSNPADDNRTILHFEVRNGRTKLDPSQWIR